MCVVAYSCFFLTPLNYIDVTLNIKCWILYLSILHLKGLAMATPSSFVWRILNPTQTRVPSAPTWRTLFPASSWRSVTRTCCSTSCPRTPAAWLVSSMFWPTTMRSWASSTSLFHRPPLTRWGRWCNRDDNIQTSPACWLMNISAKKRGVMVLVKDLL